MATFSLKPSVTFRVSVDLTEAEARALAELASYSPLEVVGALGAHISMSWVKDHGIAFRALLEEARLNLPGQLETIDRARALVDGGKAGRQT